jgi:hypothetical protein
MENELEVPHEIPATVPFTANAVRGASQRVGICSGLYAPSLSGNPYIISASTYPWSR